MSPASAPRTGAMASQPTATARPAHAHPESMIRLATRAIGSKAVLAIGLPPASTGVASQLTKDVAAPKDAPRASETKTVLASLIRRKTESRDRLPTAGNEHVLSHPFYDIAHLADGTPAAQWRFGFPHFARLGRGDGAPEPFV